MYFYHANPLRRHAQWQGPALIAGLWGGKALVAYGNSVYTISADNIHTTPKVLELLGSDESLQLHTLGQKIPLFQVVDTKAFVFLMRYRNNLAKQIQSTIATLD